MKISTSKTVKRSAKFVPLALASLMFTACVTTPDEPDPAAQARSELTELQNDPNLSSRARVEIREAESAVRLAEQSVSEDDAELGEHRVYLAEQKVAIAQAKATTRYAEHQREQLSEQRSEARLAARTREAQRAREEAEEARQSARQAVSAAERREQKREQERQEERAREVKKAREEAERARRAEQERSAQAERQAKEYQRQIEELQAEATDRGLVLTLGDVLFSTGSADLQDGSHRNLDRLVSFLEEYPERNVQIEGHTDNQGSADYNKGLSLRRADSVGAYLRQRDIDSQRISTTGIGLEKPVASNATQAGRQQNRRVEIIIDDPR